MNEKLKLHLQTKSSPLLADAEICHTCKIDPDCPCPYLRCHLVRRGNFTSYYRQQCNAISAQDAISPCILYCSANWFVLHIFSLCWLRTKGKARGIEAVELKTDRSYRYYCNLQFIIAILTLTLNVKS